MIRKPSVLIALVIVAVLLSLLAPVLSNPSGWQTSYSFAPSGHRVFFETVSKFRKDVKRWRRLPAALGGQGQALLILEPEFELLSTSEAGLQQVVTWVEQGNDLILVPRATTIEVHEMMQQRFEVSTWSWAAGAGIPLITEAFGADYSFSLHVEDNEVSVTTLVSQTEGDAPEGGTHFRVSSAPVFRAEDYGALYKSVFRVDETPMALEAEVGEGRLVVLMAPNWFLNKNFAKQENAAAVLAMLAPYGPNGLLVDEFFHGLPQVNGLLSLLFRPPFLWLSLSGLLLMALLAWSATYRTEPEKNPPLPSRRSKREHLDALGQLLASTNHHAWIVHRLLSGLEHDLRASLHLSSGYPLSDALSFLRRRDAQLADEFTALHADADHVARAPKRSDAWLEWGRRAHTMRQKLNHE